MNRQGERALGVIIAILLIWGAFEAGFMLGQIVRRHDRVAIFDYSHGPGAFGPWHGTCWRMHHIAACAVDDRVRVDGEARAQ